MPNEFDPINEKITSQNWTGRNSEISQRQLMLGRAVISWWESEQYQGDPEEFPDEALIKIIRRVEGEYQVPKKKIRDYAIEIEQGRRSARRARDYQVFPVKEKVIEVNNNFIGNVK